MDQVKSRIEQILTYFQQNKIIAILFLLMLVSIFFGNPLEFFKDEILQVGTEATIKPVKPSRITLNPFELTKLEPSAYEIQREEMEPEIKKESGVKIWKQVVKPETAPQKTAEAQKAREEAMRKAKKTGGDVLARLEAVVKIQEADPDFEGIQSNIV